MAKKKSKMNPQNTDAEKPQKKKSGAGAVFGSILFFLLTFVFSICLFCSMTLYHALPQHKFTEAIADMDLSQMQLSDAGETKQFGQCLYDWYLWDAPNLSEEYADALVQQPEFNDFVCDYLNRLGDYMTGDSSELPEMSVEEIADLMQDDLKSTLKKETGCGFAEADRKSLEWSMGDDLQGWNDDLKNTVGSGFGKFTARLVCNLSGVITFGGLTVICFVLWLIFAIKGHWRKGKLFVGYGFAAAIPNLLILVGCGVPLLFVKAFHMPDALLFAEDGLGTLLLPLVQSALTITLYGLVFACIGICTNAIVKTKRKKKAAAEALGQEEPIPSLEMPPEAATASPTEEAFRYQDIADENPMHTDGNVTVPKTCPNCGAEIPEGGQFCGSCGQKIQNI